MYAETPGLYNALVSCFMKSSSSFLPPYSGDENLITTFSEPMSSIKSRLLDQDSFYSLEYDLVQAEVSNKF